MAILIDGFKKDKDRPPMYDMQDNGVTEVKDSSELGDALNSLNNDDIEKTSRMSGIDMRSRLHYVELSSILAIDSLVSFRFLPMSCLAFTRQKKRLAVSLNGKGRDEIVSIVHGKREGDMGKPNSFFGKMKSAMFPGKE